MISELLLMAMIAVESGNNNLAVGDNGAGIGCLQIHKAVIDDVNRVYNKSYHWPESAFDRETSIIICKLYLRHYAPSCATDEQLARIWNGGPKGYKKTATLKYWSKVKRQIGRHTFGELL